MATWPSTIPVNRDGYAEKPPRRAVRSNMEVGPDKIRKRSSAAVRNVSFKLFLDDTQLETLDTFFNENEALTFDFTDPRTNTAKRARFTEEPSYSLNAYNWDVSVKLEYLP